MASSAEYTKQWRIKNPEKYAAQRERENLRYHERIKSDPEFIQLVKAKRRRADSKKKAKLLNSHERAEKHQQFKLNQFRKSIMTQAELKELKRRHKLNALEKFEATHGIKYNNYWRWSKKCGLTNIQDVIEYRNNEIAKVEANKSNTKKRKRLLLAVRKKNDNFMAEHGVSYSAYRYYFNKYGGTTEDYKAFKAKNEADRMRQKQLDLEIKVSNTREKVVSVIPKPIKQEPKPIKQYDKNQQYIDRYGVSYNTLMHYKKLHGFSTIEESLQWYKYSFGIDPTKCSKTKESAWQTMQNKISHLNCVISIESIRDAKINELQNNFYQQYGAM